MQKAPETLPVRLLKQPFIWSGVGMLIRYHDDTTVSGGFWRIVGAASLAWGIGYSIATRPNTLTVEYGTSTTP